MFSIEVELLTGRYAAASHVDRDRAEWPPHPARLFYALVAALHDESPPKPEERTALQWLEIQSPPSLDVDLPTSEREYQRDVRDVFVPVNDTTTLDTALAGDPEADLREARQNLERLEAGPRGKAEVREIARAEKLVAKEAERLERRMSDLVDLPENPSKEALRSAVALLPDRRVRQARTFPVVVPGRSTFAFTWNVDVPDDVARALASTCARVTRLGHSSSLVRCHLRRSGASPTLEPAASGDVVLRVPVAGLLERLEREHARHQAVESRSLPHGVQRYREVTAAGRAGTLPRSVFSDEWILLERVEGERPLASRTTDLTRALRAALLEMHGSMTLPPALGGHATDGGPADVPHVAFLALPNVGHEHADGAIMGCAIVRPWALGDEDVDDLLRLVAKWEGERHIDGDDTLMELGGGSLRTVRVRRVEMSSKATMNARRWCRPSTRFVTATPIALDRHPGNLRSNQDGTAHRAAREAERSIADACEAIGLPRPASVEVSLAPLLAGGQPVRSYLPWPATPGRLARARVHADIRFDVPVRGPLLLGAGRYFGLGLCMPVGEG